MRLEAAIESLASDGGHTQALARSALDASPGSGVAIALVRSLPADGGAAALETTLASPVAWGETREALADARIARLLDAGLWDEVGKAIEKDPGPSLASLVRRAPRAIGALLEVGRVEDAAGLFERLKARKLLELVGELTGRVRADARFAALWSSKRFVQAVGSPDPLARSAPYACELTLAGGTALGVVRVIATDDTGLVVMVPGRAAPLRVSKDRLLPASAFGVEDEAFERADRAAREVRVAPKEGEYAWQEGAAAGPRACPPPRRGSAGRRRRLARQAGARGPPRARPRALPHGGPEGGAGRGGARRRRSPGGHEEGLRGRRREPPRPGRARRRRSRSQEELPPKLVEETPDARALERHLVDESAAKLANELDDLGRRASAAAKDATDLATMVKEQRVLSVAAVSAGKAGPLGPLLVRLSRAHPFITAELRRADTFPALYHALERAYERAPDPGVEQLLALMPAVLARGAEPLAEISTGELQRLVDGAAKRLKDAREATVATLKTTREAIVAVRELELQEVAKGTRDADLTQGVKLLTAFRKTFAGASPNLFATEVAGVYIDRNDNRVYFYLEADDRG